MLLTFSIYNVILQFSEEMQAFNSCIEYETESGVEQVVLARRGIWCINTFTWPQLLWSDLRALSNYQTQSFPHSTRPMSIGLDLWKVCGFKKIWTLWGLGWLCAFILSFERCATAGLERLMPSAVCCTKENHTRFLSGRDRGTAGLRE